MKRLFSLLVILTVFTFVSIAQVLSPYTLGATSSKGLEGSCIPR